MTHTVNVDLNDPKWGIAWSRQVAHTHYHGDELVYHLKMIDCREAIIDQELTLAQLKHNNPYSQKWRDEFMSETQKQVK